MSDVSTEAKPLDEVLLAMDVVDTLRHRENTLMRELDEEGRRGELITRLKDINDARHSKSSALRICHQSHPCRCRWRNSMSPGADGESQ